MSVDKVKGWIGIFLIVWPMIRAVAVGFGINLPEISGAENAGLLSQGIGTYLTASAAPVMGKNKDKRMVS